MENIYIEKSNRTPHINFNAETGIFEIMGWSTPENSAQFYEPLLVWLGEYIEDPAEKTVVNVQLEYYNTSSSKWILELFIKLERIHKSGHNIVVNWHYMDEDLLETGEDYKSIVSIPFNMIDAG